MTNFSVLAIRYYQYLMDLENKGIITAYNEKLSESARKMAFKKVKAKINSEEYFPGNDEDSVVDITPFSINLILNTP